jgi:hypothetical protein
MKSYLTIRQKIVILILFLINNSLYSQNYNWFSYDTNNQSYIAEMHSSLLRMELVKWNKLHPFYYKSNATERPFIEVQTGFKLPIFSIENSFEHFDIKASISTPVSILTLVDMFESETAPVINNDYRFGVQMLFLFTPQNTNNSYFKNYHITLVPIFHESTHIGDEFALHGYSQIPNFSRINVSYEAWQIFAGVNRQHNDKNKRNLSAEIGYQRLMPYKVGYYDIDTFEVKGYNIIPSEKRDLWIFRTEYCHHLKLKNNTESELIASIEARREIRFGYTLNEPEKRVWSFNLYLGYRIPIKNTQKQLGIYYRYYRGIVPYGQLRNEDGFALNGISLVIN